MLPYVSIDVNTAQVDCHIVFHVDKKLIEVLWFGYEQFQGSLSFLFIRENWAHYLVDAILWS